MMYPTHLNTFARHMRMRENRPVRELTSALDSIGTEMTDGEVIRAIYDHGWTVDAGIVTNPSRTRI